MTDRPSLSIVLLIALSASVIWYAFGREQGSGGSGSTDDSEIGSQDGESRTLLGVRSNTPVKSANEQNATALLDHRKDKLDTRGSSSELWPAIDVEITVTNPNLELVPAVPVELQLWNESESIELWKASTNDSGVARFSGVLIPRDVQRDPGSYRVGVVLPGTLPDRVDKFLWGAARHSLESTRYYGKIEESPTVLRATIRYSGLAQKELWLTTPVGVGISGVRVAPFPEKLDYRYGLLPVVTDEQGHAVFRVPDGWVGRLRLIMAQDFEFHQDLRLDNLPQTKLHLTPALTGEVATSDGTPVVGAKLVVVKQGGFGDIGRKIVLSRLIGASVWDDQSPAISGKKVVFLVGDRTRPASIQPEHVRWGVQDLSLQTDDKGRFAAVGLKPGERYSVWLSELGGIHRCVCASAFAGTHVRAQVNRISVAWRFIDRLSGDVIEDSIYAKRAWLAPEDGLVLTKHRGLHFLSSAELEFFVVPQPSHWVIRAKAEGYVSRDHVFSIKDEHKNGHVFDIELEPMPDGAPLRVTCRTSDGKAVRNVPLLIMKDGGSRGCPVIRWKGEEAHVHYLGEGEVQFAVQFSASAIDKNESFRYLMNRTWDPIAPEARAGSKIELPIALGGDVRFEVRFHGGTVRSPRANLTLASGDGEIAFDQSVGVRDLDKKSNSRPVVIDTQAVAPGLYRATLTYPRRGLIPYIGEETGTAVVTKEVSVVAGKTIEVRFDLDIPNPR